MNVSNSVLEGQSDSYRIAERLSLPGSARLFRVDGRPELLYKQFKVPRSGSAEIDRIEWLIEIGRDFAAAGGSRSTAEHIAWPRDLVVVGDEAVGVVIPYAGDRFFRPEIAGDRQPRDLGYLRRDGRDEGITTLVRLNLMRQLAEAMEVFEHAELVHGDISHLNLIWAPPPGEAVMLVDCDGIHSASSQGHGGATPNWTDPRKLAGEISAHDQDSDRFALSLAVWRVLSMASVRAWPPHKAGRLALSRSLPAPVRKLLERSFTDTSATPRPLPSEWVKALDAALGSRRVQRRSGRSGVEPAALFRYDGDGGSSGETGSWVYAPPESPKPRRARKIAPAESGGAGSVSSGGKGRLNARRVVFFAALLALTTVLVKAGFDSGPSAAQRRAQTQVAKWAKSSLGVRGVSADCPGDSSLHAGAHYLCKVETHSGAVARVRVAIGAGGGISRRMRINAYRKRAVVVDIRARYRRLRQRGGYGLKQISCPQTFSANPGTEFRCSARFTDGVKGPISVTLHSRRGGFSWNEVGQGVGGRGSALH